MIGGLLALASAVTFAYANASVRRGVLTGTVLQAVAISLPVALPFFVLAMLMTGGFHPLASFSWRSLGLLALAGVIHFAWARHCNYRATKAMGANLVAPIQQYSLVITLVLAVVWLGEALTLLRIIGIVLVIVGPALTHERGNTARARSRFDRCDWRHQSIQTGSCGGIFLRTAFGNRVRHQPHPDRYGVRYKGHRSRRCRRLHLVRGGDRRDRTDANFAAAVA